MEIGDYANNCVETLARIVNEKVKVWGAANGYVSVLIASLVDRFEEKGSKVEFYSDADESVLQDLEGVIGLFEKKKDDAVHNYYIGKVIEKYPDEKDPMEMKRLVDVYAAENPANVSLSLTTNTICKIEDNAYIFQLLKKENDKSSESLYIVNSKADKNSANNSDIPDLSKGLLHISKVNLYLERVLEPDGDFYQAIMKIADGKV